jgi:thiol-disulfide isomerase/thioredoxin
MNSSQSIVSESPSLIKRTVQSVANFIRNNLKWLVIAAVVAVIAAVLIKKFIKKPEAVPQTTTPSVEGFDDGSSTLRIFHVDWCGHCKKMVPEFNKLMGLAENDDSTSEKDINVKDKSVKLVKINPEQSTDGGDLAKKYNVQGYPTIIFTTGGKDIQYEGGPSVDSLKSFLESNL